MSVRYLEVPLTILDTEQLSESAEISASLPVALSIPSTFDGVEIKPEASIDEGATFLPVYDDEGTEVAIVVTVAPSHIFLLPQEYAGFDFIRFKATTAQTGDSVINLILRAE